MWLFPWLQNSASDQLMHHYCSPSFWIAISFILETFQPLVNPIYQQYVQSTWELELEVYPSHATSATWWEKLYCVILSCDDVLAKAAENLNGDNDTHQEHQSSMGWRRKHSTTRCTFVAWQQKKPEWVFPTYLGYNNIEFCCLVSLKEYLTFCEWPYWWLTLFELIYRCREKGKCSTYAAYNFCLSMFLW
jgi:hypothetical protein